MLRWFGGLTAATGALLVLLAPAASARECPDNWVNRLAVNDYVRAGQPFTIGYGVRRPEYVHDLTVTVDGVTYPLASSEEESVKVRAPGATGVFDIVFRWRKGRSADTVDEQLDCDGIASYGMFSVPPNAKFGATEGTRVDGLWRVQLTPRKVNVPKIRTRWQMRPKCDYYACDTIVTGRGERYDTSMWRDMYVDNVNGGLAACYTRSGRPCRAATEWGCSSTSGSPATSGSTTRSPRAPTGSKGRRPSSSRSRAAAAPPAAAR